MTMHQPEAPPLTEKDLIIWLETVDPSKVYVYQDPARCLLGQYFTDHGAEGAIAEITYEQFPNYREIAEPKPHTFGAALGRAEKLLALPPPTPAFDQSQVEVGEPVPAEGSGR